MGYILICDECGGDKVCYVVETGQNTTKYQGKHPDSPIWKHAQMAHGGNTAVSFSMKVIKSFRDPLTRQINEAVRKL